MAKLKKNAPKALTANRLSDGIVVFMKADGTWSEVIHDAHIAYDNSDSEKLVDQGKISSDANEVVEPYLFNVTQNGSEIVATHIREYMRTQGPSVRRDLGKQADGLARQAA